MIWLGSRRGQATDWLTQRWVQATGRRIGRGTEPWLEGPIAPTTGIGPDYFAAFAEGEGLRLESGGTGAGLIPAFASLRGPGFDPSAADPRVVRFYEHTSDYDLDAWSEWRGAFRPFGRGLAVLFSRRLQQLNVPLSGLDTSRGLSSEVLHFTDPATGHRRHTAWYRRFQGSGDVLYAGFYSACNLPGRDDPCLKVVFPLPNGNAIVLLRTEVRADGSLVVTSAGDRFGDPGFYFTVHDPAGGVRWARHVRALRESIHVYADGRDVVRADHVLTFGGVTFLRLHYRMQPRPGPGG